MLENDSKKIGEKVACLPFMKLRKPSMILPYNFIPLTINDIEDRNIPLREITVCPDLFNMPILTMEFITNQELMIFYLERIAFIKSKWRFYCKQTGLFVTSEIAKKSNDMKNEYIDTQDLFSYFFNDQGEKLDPEENLKITLNTKGFYDDEVYKKFFEECSNTVKAMNYLHERKAFTRRKLTLVCDEFIQKNYVKKTFNISLRSLKYEKNKCAANARRLMQLLK